VNVPSAASAASTAQTATYVSPASYWIVKTRSGHEVSLYPIVLPVLVAPLYLPAVACLHARGWSPSRLDWLARVMEKLSASLIAATAAALLFLLLWRRAPRGWSIHL